MIFELAEDFNKNTFLKRLKTRFKFTITREKTFVTKNYDTFDWRLYKNGMQLSLQSRKLFLHSIEYQQMFATLNISSVPNFVNKFPQSEIKSKLAPLVEMRALLYLFSLIISRTRIAILDNNKKTVVRIFLQENQIKKDKHVVAEQSVLQLLAIKGYIPKFNTVLSWLKEQQYQVTEKSLFELALQKMNIKPGEYSTKIEVMLQSNTRSDQAVKMILSNLLDTIKKNEQGVIEDIDTEFLHDFRVSVRRTRSALGQIKNIFPKAITDKAKKDFRYLGDITNSMRDIDVYLLKENYYKSQLPESMRKELDNFFSYLQKKRIAERKKLVQNLNSVRYKKIIASWEAFLSKPVPGNPGATSAQVEIIKLAKEIIRKKYMLVLSDGEKITVDSPDIELHRLRIDCKKLRYMLEFFQSLFPLQKIQSLIKQLKSLQDNLGDFNDLFVQQQTLKDFAESSVESADTILAVGVLIGKLNEKQIQTRKDFFNIYNTFSSGETQHLFSSLIASENGSKK